MNAMSLKQRILNRIKSINDPEVLCELDEWISEREREAEKTGTVNESGKSYRPLPSKKRSKAEPLLTLPYYNFILI